MKKIMILLVIILAYNSRSQNYSIIQIDTVKYGNCGELLLPSVTFFNNTAGTNSPTTVYMHMERIVKNIPSGWTSCFCSPICLPQAQSVYDFTIGTEGRLGGSTQSVTPNFGTDTIPGVGEVIVVFSETGINHFDTIRFRGITSKVSGIKENKSDLPEFILFPNPASKFITVSSDKNLTSTTFEVFSLTGQKLLEKHSNSILSDAKTTLNLEAFSEGMYYLRISAGDYYRIKKFSISN